MAHTASAPAPVVYRDFWFKIIGCLVASELIDSLGRADSIFDRIFSLTFFIDLLGGFFISLLLWEMVRYVTRRLDRQFDWLTQPAQRIALQVLLGVIIPAALAFVFTLFFMRVAYQQNIFDTTWLHSEFYAVILIILLINLVYFTWWLLIKNKGSHTFALANKELPAKLIPQTVQVSKGNVNVILQPEEIAYITLDGSYSFVYTHTGEHFVTTYTLDELTKRLGEIAFFRANRQVIISRSSCKSYRRIENGKIGLDVIPAPKDTVIISQKRASDFRKWIALEKMPADRDIL